MKNFLAISALTASLAASQDQVSFPINLKVDGKSMDLFLHQTKWSDFNIYDGINGTEFEYNDRDRGYISTSEQPEPYSYFRPNLLGGYVTYDVDLSEMPCGCITALYSTYMPAKNADGSLQNNHYWYCGAQQSKYGGISCPEFDVMEANQWGFHTTAHACEPPNEFGHWGDTSCDLQGQCVIDIEDVGAVDRYGPGYKFDINTLLPYNVRLDYHEFDGKFTGYTTTMTQGDQQIVLNGEGHECRDYLNRMTDVIIDGMAWTFSSWRPPSAKWLQGDRCNEKCEWPVATTFKNLEFWTYGSEKSSKDVELVYGNSCSDLRDGLCDSSCTECSYSYPVDDPLMWDSDWARCRCKDDKVYKYGNQCAENLDQGKCGKDCEFCNMSWCPNDRDKWTSHNMQCRCVPTQPTDITYGSHQCNESDDGICGDSCTECRWSWPSNDIRKWLADHAMCRCADNQPSESFNQ